MVVRHETHVQRGGEAVHKKNLFPIQRVAQIMATQAATNSICLFLPPPFFFVRKFNSSFFFGGGGGEGNRKLKKRKKKKRKKKRKVPVGTNILTRPLDRKQTFFKDSLMCRELVTGCQRRHAPSMN